PFMNTFTYVEVSLPRRCAALCQSPPTGSSRPALRSHGPGRCRDGLHDEVITRAAAEMAGEHLADGLLARRGLSLEEGAGAHDDARRAVAALKPVLGPERLLQGMEVLGRRRHALDGSHLVPVSLHGEHEAGADRLAVQEHGARAAHPVLAPDVGTRQ